MSKSFQSIEVGSLSSEYAHRTGRQSDCEIRTKTFSVDAYMLNE